MPTNGQQSTPVLTAREATVQTASISIQTLRIGTKQVTMGLFRQLPLRMLVDESTIRLQGTPWGAVNYFWEGDGRGRDYAAEDCLHFVWQTDATLYRGLVSQLPPVPLRDTWKLKRLQIETNMCFLRLLTTTDVVSASAIPSGYPAKVVIDGVPLTVNIDSTEWNRVYDYLSYRSHQYNPKLAAYERLLDQRGLSHRQLTRCEEDLRALDEAVADYTHRWSAQWGRLTALPQLFIAV